MAVILARYWHLKRDYGRNQANNRVAEMLSYQDAGEVRRVLRSAEAKALQAEITPALYCYGTDDSGLAFVQCISLPDSPHYISQVLDGLNKIAAGSGQGFYTWCWYWHAAAPGRAGWGERMIARDGNGTWSSLRVGA